MSFFNDFHLEQCNMINTIEPFIKNLFAFIFKNRPVKRRTIGSISIILIFFLIADLCFKTNQPQFYLINMFAVVLSIIYGRIGPGFISALTQAILINYLLITPISNNLNLKNGGLILISFSFFMISIDFIILYVKNKFTHIDSFHNYHF